MACMGHTFGWQILKGNQKKLASLFTLPTCSRYGKSISLLFQMIYQWTDISYIRMIQVQTLLILLGVSFTKYNMQTSTHT